MKNILTVKSLKEQIQYLPDDMIINIERIEDVYFDKYNWSYSRTSFETPHIENMEYIKAMDITPIYENNTLIIGALYPQI